MHCAVNIRFLLIPSPTLSGMTFTKRFHKTHALSFLSCEYRLLRVMAVSALRRDGDRERLGRLRVTHPFALAFPYVLLTVRIRPLNHAEAYKESDVRSCLFRQFISPVLYKLLFPTYFTRRRSI